MAYANESWLADCADWLAGVVRRDAGIALKDADPLWAEAHSPWNLAAVMAKKASVHRRAEVRHQGAHAVDALLERANMCS